MKVLVNLIILSIIAGGGYYLYEQNKEQLNETLNSVKETSVESVTDGLVEKVKIIDADELIELAMDNKEQILKVMHENNIKLENIDMDALKSKLSENGIDLDKIDLSDVELQEKLKTVMESTEK